MGWLENLDRAAGAGVCNLLSNGGNAALASGIIGAALVPGGQIPALAAGLGLVALNAGCAFDPTKKVGREDFGGYCGYAGGGLIRLSITNSSGLEFYWSNWVEIKAFYTAPAPGNPNLTAYFVTGTRPNAAEEKTELVAYAGKGDTWETRPLNGPCEVVAPPAPAPEMPVYDYDGSTNNDCDMSVQLLAWNVKPDGSVEPVLKIEQTPAAGRANDPVISGCNFEPVIYIGDPGGGPGNPPRVIPWTPEPDGPDGTPWWVKKVTYGKEGPTLEEIEKLLEERLPSKVPGSTYELRSVCEVDGDGNPVQDSVTKDVKEGASIESVISRLDALPELLQGLKDFKQPTCPKVPRPVGRGVTVHFRQIAADDGQYLRKTFRYRAQGPADLTAHTDHWKGFQWQTGPVCVISKGLDWGVPQVWADSEAEGKRVIQHAADIAGVDLLDPRHEWIVTSSGNSRYGRSALVGVEKRRDVYGVSMRDGPDGLPLRMRVEGSYPTP